MSLYRLCEKRWIEPIRRVRKTAGPFAAVADCFNDHRCNSMGEMGMDTGRSEEGRKSINPVVALLIIGLAVLITAYMLWSGVRKPAVSDSESNSAVSALSTPAGASGGPVSSRPTESP